MASSQGEYGPNWREVVEYLEDVPTGFMLNNMGEENPADGRVVRVRSWPDMERAVHIPEDGSPDNSPYLAFLMNVGIQSNRVDRVGQELGLSAETKKAGYDAGTKYADEFEDWPDTFYDWLGKAEEVCYYFYTGSIQDHANDIGRAIVLGRRAETEVFYDLWYWYRAGHWPCGWEGDWPEGRLIVF